MNLRSLFFTTIFISNFFITACDMLEKSDYSNCVIAESENSYIGEKLKHDDKAKNSRMLTTACIAKDQEIDSGDGNEKGKVRWVVCLKGPDCDEAGMF